MMGLDRDRLAELVQVVVRNPLRAFLSALGVGWGLFMIIITVGAARGLENGVKADMGSDVSNSMFAWTMSTSLPYKGYQRGRYVEMDIDDVNWLQANTQHLDLVCPEVQLGGVPGHQQCCSRQAKRCLRCARGHSGVSAGETHEHHGRPLPQ